MLESGAVPHQGRQALDVLQIWPQPGNLERRAKVEHGRGKDLERGGTSTCRPARAHSREAADPEGWHDHQWYLLRSIPFLGGMDRAKRGWRQNVGEDWTYRPSDGYDKKGLGMLMRRLLRKRPDPRIAKYTDGIIQPSVVSHGERHFAFTHALPRISLRIWWRTRMTMASRGHPLVHWMCPTQIQGLMPWP